MANYNVQLSETFQALADPTRLAVVQQLAQGPAAVKVLAEPFEMALPSFLKHINILEESGVIATRKQGRVRTCQLRSEKLNEITTWLDEQKAIWSARTDRMEDYIQTMKKGEQYAKQ